MKNLVSMFVLMWLFTTSAEGQHLVVTSYNLRGEGDPGNEWEDRQLMVADQMNKYRFDIIGVQETTGNMVGHLISAVPRFDSLGTFLKVPTGILYNTERLQELSHGHFWLSATPDVESKGWDAKFNRICVWAKFRDLINGMEFYVFNSHFDHVGVLARTNSTTLVLQKINEIAGNAPTIMMGDLNISQYDPNYITINNSGLLKDTKNLAVINHEKERGTGNGFDINRRDRTRVDHIFATETWQAYQHDVLLDLYNGKTPSDHYGLMTVIGRKTNDLGDLYRNFPEDFENPDPVKTSYGSGNVTYRTGSWTLNNAIAGGSAGNDQNTSGGLGVRMIDNNTVSAYLQMNFDVTEGASKVTLQHSTYNMDSTSKWQLEYSTNQGISWIATGPIMATHQLNKQQATFIVDIPGNVRFRINKLGIGSGNNGRLCIDDFTIYKRKNSGNVKKGGSLLAWQFASPASTGRESSASSSLTDPSLNVSVLARGSGFRTVTNTSANINLTGGFAAAATVASSLFASDTTVALANNLYFEFKVNPKPGNRISLSTIDARLMSSGSTLKLWYWKYSLDGVNFKQLSKPYLFNSTASTAQATLDLSPFPELQIITSDKTVYFRLYVTGTNAAEEILGIGVSNPSSSNDYVLTVSGTVEKTPPVSRLVAWQLQSPVAAGNEVSKTASIIDAAVTATPLVRGAGLVSINSYYPTPVALSRAFVAVTTHVSSATLADTSVAIANDMYFAYSVKVKPNNRVSLNTLDYKVRISGGGGKVWYWKYSLDSVTFKKLGIPLVLSAGTDTEGEIQPQVNLSGIADLQNIPAGTTIYFRLYTNGSNNTSGTTAIGRSASSTDYVISLNGTSRSDAPDTPLAAWQFATPARSGGELSADASLISPAINAGQLHRGAGIKATDNATGQPYVLSRTFVSVTAIPSTAAIIDTAVAVANDMYFGFNVGVKPGYKISLSSLKYKVRISGGGAKVWYWKYSLDGVNFEKITSPNVLSGATNDGGDVQPVIDLSGIPVLQNLAAGKVVYFRLYTNGSNVTTGTTALGRSALSTSDDYALLVGGHVESVSTPVKIIAWQFATPQKAGNEASIAATTLSNAITATSLVRGAGLAAASLSRAFTATTTHSSSPDITDTVTAVANNMYFGFSITVKAGKKINLSGLDYKIRATGGGAKVFYWKYSLDGTSFHKVENPQNLAITGDGEGVYMPNVDLSTISELQNIHAGSTVHFRLYMNGSNTTTGSSSIGRSASSSTEDVLYLSGTEENEVLPVQLVSFSGRSQGSRVELNWQTVSEHNNSHFEILHIHNGSKSSVIGKVNSNGQSSNLKRYSFIDTDPSLGVNYYQLRQMDLNGKFFESEIIMIKNDYLANSFSISANEREIQVFVFADAEAQVDFILSNMMGQALIKRQLKLVQGNNSVTIAANFPKGIYVGTLVRPGKNKISKKIIL